MAYLIRRLMENTSNTSFLRQTYAEDAEIDKLIVTPKPKGARGFGPSPSKKTLTPQPPGPLRNEPLLDFSRTENRARFAQGLQEVRQKFGRDYPLWIGGGEEKNKKWVGAV